MTQGEHPADQQYSDDRVADEVARQQRAARVPERRGLRLLRAVESGWELMDEGSKSLAFQTTEPGAYRAEVRIRPRHLLAQLSSYAELAEKSFVWIYSNPIYVK